MPTKADPLHERLDHVFGRSSIKRQLERMMFSVEDIVNNLTDEARTELIKRLIGDTKFARKIRTQNRRIAAERPSR
jgi:hypothetical protein